MAFAAKLYGDQRAGDRYTVDLPGTLRDGGLKPVDIIVDDLSRSGFRIVTSAVLPACAIVSVGIAGAGMRYARIVRSGGGGDYGCEFLAPLTAPELVAAVAAVPPAVPILPSAMPPPADPLDPPGRRYSPRARITILIGSASAAWALLAAIAIALS